MAYLSNRNAENSYVLEETASALDLYVDSTNGDDANPGTSMFPFRTVQAAVNYVPRHVRHTVTVTAKAGNYGGFEVSGFIVRPGGSLTVQGTLAAPTLTTGTTTGTLTAFSASSGTTKAVFTDSGQAWTVNELKGKLIKMSGTGSNVRSTFVILSNTDTTITAVGIITGFTTSSTYEILEQKSVINTPAAAIVNAQTALSNYAATGVLVAGCVSDGNQLTDIMIQGFAFTFGSSGVGVSLDSSVSAFVRWNKFTTNVSTGIQLNSRACVAAYGNYYASQSLTGVNLLNALKVTVADSFFEAGLRGVTTSNVTTMTLSSNHFSAQTTYSIGSGTGALGTSQLVGNTIDGSATGISFIASVSNGSPSVALSSTSMKIDNCTTAAVDLAGPKSNAFFSVVVGTGNAIGMRLRWGAKVGVTSATTLTGTIEVEVDGTESDLAEMRALTPKAYPEVASPFGTGFFEH